MTNSSFMEGYLRALQFAQEMLELNGNTAGVEQLKAIIENMSEINMEETN